MNFHFDGAVAEMYGVDGAVFISRLQFWIEKNAANDRHYHEGRYWTYNSLRAMEKLFPFWSRRQIERIVKNLKDKGVLLTANYARDSYDRTLFYALDESKLPISPFGGDLSPNGDNPLSPNGDNMSPNGEMINEQLKTQIREEEDKANKPEISNKPQQLADRYNAICTNLPTDGQAPPSGAPDLRQGLHAGAARRGVPQGAGEQLLHRPERPPLESGL